LLRQRPVHPEEACHVVYLARQQGLEKSEMPVWSVESPRPEEAVEGGEDEGVRHRKRGEVAAGQVVYNLQNQI
jgi:hypothetical protein